MAGIRLIAQLRVADGKGQEFIDAWADHVAAVGREPGCLQYDMFRSVSDPDHIALLEHWLDRDAFETHWALELTQPGGAGVGAVADLVVESDGALYHTEIYARVRQQFTGTDWETVDG